MVRRVLNRICFNEPRLQVKNTLDQVSLYHFNSFYTYGNYIFTMSLSFEKCTVLGLSIVVVALIVVIGRNPGVGGMQWAYEIGVQPFYRLIFLLIVLIIASNREYFPVALLLVLLYLVINSMVPLISGLPEYFLHNAAPPLTDCNAYDKESVKTVGTPFYPINHPSGNPASHAQTPSAASTEVAHMSNPENKYMREN